MKEEERTEDGDDGKVRTRPDLFAIAVVLQSLVVLAMAAVLQNLVLLAMTAVLQSFEFLQLLL